MSGPDVRYVRRLLGRHDRWSHPLLSVQTRRSAARLARTGFAHEFFDFTLMGIYTPDYVERLVYPESPLMAMLVRTDEAAAE